MYAPRTIHFKALFSSFLPNQKKKHQISIFVRLILFTREGTSHILSLFYDTHSHDSCRPSGDCGDAGNEPGTAAFSRLSHHILPSNH
jgi:hypothetical protein